MAQTIAPPPPPALAPSAASRHFSANLQAIAQSQPALIGLIRRRDTEWTFLRGRDNSLTAQSPDGQWLADCSLPTRAAAAMLKSLDLRGTTACLLAPNHAAQIRRSLDLLKPEQAVLTICPDTDVLPMALHCEDFTADIAAHRLFFAVGPNWSDMLADLFAQYPGLPTPAMFIRPPTTSDAVSQPLIGSAQSLFNKTNASRNAATSATPAPAGTGRVCVVAPSVYRLWSDAGTTLADLLPANNLVRFNPDHPTTASHHALALAARGCRALFAANIARADVPANVIPATTPWITWITTGTIPDGRKSAPHDRLILADPAWPKLATAAGWDKSQLTVAAWPAVALADPPLAPLVGLIADTHALRADITDETFEFSSHMVLWELIASELHSNPLLAAADPAAYLDARLASLSIQPDGFDRALFLDQLIHPAYHQGLARMVLAAGLSLRLFGQGWNAIPEFAPHAAGPIRSHDELHQAASSVTTLIRPTHTPSSHPIDALPRPIIMPSATFLHDLRAASTPRSSPIARLTAKMLAALIDA